ncbi:nitrite reductase/ring-hydroxylating ferredoxin subunit [Terracoccus luteus]|uniref:Nitrite reductase/ring-hydroxylating ferredoxin subunit n=1 Tax=Terracoccus luteus TaxID=53356 RepID=A0A495Y299_9MICO|nr:Rieske (2Fe-2S) protein [Terracoccus luteus]RKT78138.1 nitrite reductase/ring-hydroxylating ferredoxin subunit [Terracoccus luteus]
MTHPQPDPTNPAARPTAEDVPETVSPALAARLTDRRNVLRVATVVAGAGALAACSSPPVQPEAGQAAGGASSAPSSSTSASTPAETSTSTSSAASSSSAAGGTATSEVPVGGGTIYTDTKTVVTQPTAGTFKAFDTTCPHQGCPVTKVADGRIDCPCHGSQFDISTGDRVAGPAPKGLTPKQITVTGDTFTVA